MTDTTPNRRTSVVLPEDLWERAVRAADAEADRTGYRVTVSDLIRRGLRREVDCVESRE